MPVTLTPLRFVALLTTALALAMETAHVLELPQKLQYEAELYSAVNTTLYRYFAVIGGPLQIGSMLAALALVAAAYRRGVAWTVELAGALALIAAFAVWLTVVAPVNARIADRLAVTPHQVPALWMALRLRWELGHAGGFVLQLLGFGLLLLASLRAASPTPQGQAGDAAQHAAGVLAGAVGHRALPARPDAQRAANEALDRRTASLIASEARMPLPPARRNLRASRIGRAHLTLVRHP